MSGIFFGYKISGSCFFWGLHYEAPWYPPRIMYKMTSKIAQEAPWVSALDTLHVDVHEGQGVLLFFLFARSTILCYFH